MGLAEALWDNSTPMAFKAIDLVGIITQFVVANITIGIGLIEPLIHVNVFLFVIHIKAHVQRFQFFISVRKRVLVENNGISQFLL